MGTGNPQHLTLQALDALNMADLILIPRKADGKDDLAELRLALCAQVLKSQGIWPGPRVQQFDMPERDRDVDCYTMRVQAWHSQIAEIWIREISRAQGAAGRVAFLVWGDPCLYDSTLRIARQVASAMPLQVEVVPGISSLQTLTAGHCIALNELAEPFVVTTGRRLREKGWPDDVSTLIVMLDSGGAFQSLTPEGIHIWWSAYAGMPQELRLAGPLSQVADQIMMTREVARKENGWIMDIYLLRRA